MIIRNSTYLQDGMPTRDMISGVLEEHMQNLPRLEKLRRYYMGKSAITERYRDKGMPNNRLSHPIARYITTVAAGFLTGKPIEYSSDTVPETLAIIVDAFKRASVASIDAENARNASICGRAVEYIYVGADDLMPRISVLKPEQAFVVYDESYETVPLFGVYFSARTDQRGARIGYDIVVMGKKRIAKYTAETLAATDLKLVEELEHFFGDVPLVEYWNDESESGDFEWVISLIDGYDKLQSDRVNDKEQFTNALLLLVGCTMENDENGRTPSRQLREDKMLSLPDAGADARYLTAQMDESGAEVLREALAEDLHRLSMVPNLADKDFASNASGVAMRYKLWGLEQLTNIKQQWFTEGLRMRLKLFVNYMETRGAPHVDIADVQIKFTRALPVNKLENAKYVQTADAAGAMSIEEKVDALHEGEDWNEADRAAEVARIKEETAQPDLLNPFRTPPEDDGELTEE